MIVFKVNVINSYNVLKFEKITYGCTCLNVNQFHYILTKTPGFILDRLAVKTIHTNSLKLFIFKKI